MNETQERLVIPPTKRKARSTPQGNSLENTRALRRFVSCPCNGQEMIDCPQRAVTVVCAELVKGTLHIRDFLPTRAACLRSVGHVEQPDFRAFQAGLCLA